MDTTAIQCAECFELSDHKGHRIQLKRNVGGCCDCGDPDAWKPQGNCSKHQGFKNIDTKKVIENMPESIRRSAFSVFGGVIKELRHRCLNLLDYQVLCLNSSLSEVMFREMQSLCIRVIFKFLSDRIQECPNFIHILDICFNQIQIDTKKFLKSEGHSKCCLKVWLLTDKEQKEEYEEVFQTHQMRDQLCSCNCIDLCLQSNSLCDSETRQIIYEFFLKMFQNFHFKQTLTLSYASNYESIMDKTHLSPSDINHIGVQLLTSAEHSALVVDNPQLVQTVMKVYMNHLKKFAGMPNDRHQTNRMYNILHELKYMSSSPRPHMITKLIEPLHYLYFIDCFKPRTEMVANQYDGKFNENIINIEFYIFKIIQVFSVKLNFVKDRELIKKILVTFLELFKKIAQLFEDNKMHEIGFINVPAHRVFAPFLVQLLLSHLYNPDFNFMEEFVHQKAPLSKVFRRILSIYLKNEEIDLCIQIPIHTLTKQISFIQEIQARKWVYYDFILNHYPTVYYSNELNASYRDLALFQLALCCDDIDYVNRDIDQIDEDRKPLISQIVENFGLDGQLQILIQGVTKKKLIDADFKGYQRFDEEKLRTQLTLFLRFMIHICIQETPFASLLSKLSLAKIEEIWQQVMLKEACHFLFVNKEFVPIEVLNKMTILTADPVFEEQLFKVSEQRRDGRGMMTFKVKDEYVKFLDPFMYVNPSHHSNIFQMYYEYLKSKPDCNDIVGDFQHYKFSTPINNYLISLLARDQTLTPFIIELLTIWIEKKIEQKDPPLEQTKNKQDQVIFSDPQLQDTHQKLAGIFTRLKFESQSQQIGSFLSHINLLQKQMMNQQALLAAYNKEFVSKFIDQNVAYHCLKLLVLFLNAHASKRIPNLETKKFVEKSRHLIEQFVQMRIINSEDTKLCQVLDHIMQQYVQISEEEIKQIVKPLPETESTSVTNQKSISPKNFKQKQNKLLQKMKNKGKKILDTKKQQSLDTQTEEKCEEITCAFCQETLVDFQQQLFGRFMFAQSSRILCHSIEQTILNQRKAFSNANLAMQGVQAEEEKQQNYIIYPESKQFFKEPPEDKDDALKQFWPNHHEVMRGSETVRLMCQEQKFMNSMTGSGGVVNCCKHFSHYKCLTKYLNERDILDNQFQKQLSGFALGEFACPICKQLMNGLLPTFLDLKKTQGKQLDIQRIHILLDVLSTVLLKQQGFLEKSKKNEGAFTGKSIVLSDVKKQPISFVELLTNFMIHSISLTDIKGLAELSNKGIAESLGTIQLAAREVLHYVIHEQLKDEITISSLCKALLSDSLANFKNSEEGLPFFLKNITAQCIFCLVVSSLQYDPENEKFCESLKVIAQSFYNLLRIQALITLLFQQQNGQVHGDPMQIRKQFSAPDMIFLNQQINEDESLKEKYVDILLPSLRKMFATVYVLKQLLNQEYEDILNEIRMQSSNNDELDVIINYLQLQDALSIRQLVLVTPDSDAIMSKSGIESLLRQFSSPEFLSNQLLNLAFALTPGNKEQYQVKMPSPLLVLTPFFSFDLIQIPQNYTDLQLEFYKKECYLCQRSQVKDFAICLLCSKVCCFGKSSCTINLGQGPLSWHAQMHEGGQAVFMQVDIGIIIAIGNNGSAAHFDSPYRTKYGETLTQSAKNPNDYVMDSNGGGQQQLESFKQNLLNFQLSTRVLSQRTNPDSKFKVFISNAI